MSELDIIRTAGDLIAETMASGELESIAQDFGGFTLKAGGSAIVGNLAVRNLNALLCRFAAAKDAADSAIPPDFAKTAHGAKLLEDALNAMFAGIDQDRADAVSSVFVELAKNPPGDSSERAEQLEILSIVSDLSTWEVISLNLHERFVKHVYDQGRENRYLNGDRSSPEKYSGSTRPPRTWLPQHIEDSVKQERIWRAFDSLHRKNLFRLKRSTLQILDDANLAALSRQGYLTDWGWKIVQHLYSAEVPPKEAT